MGFFSGAAGGIASAGAGLVGSLIGKDISGSNLALQKENLAYQKWAQQETWNREDNATQRKVADLKAAGLSPVLAAGSASPTSAPIQTQAPQQANWADGLGEKVGISLGTAMNIASTMAGIEQQMANISKTRAEEDYTRLQIERGGVELGQIRDLIPLKYKLAMLENAYKQGQIDRTTLENEVKRYNLEYSRNANLRTTDSWSGSSFLGSALTTAGKFSDEFFGPPNKSFSKLFQIGGQTVQKLTDGIFSKAQKGSPYKNPERYW